MRALFAPGTPTVKRLKPQLRKGAVAASGEEIQQKIVPEMLVAPELGEEFRGHVLCRRPVSRILF
jgi:hypothetical protein